MQRVLLRALDFQRGLAPVQTLQVRCPLLLPGLPLTLSIFAVCAVPGDGACLRGGRGCERAALGTGDSPTRRHGHPSKLQMRTPMAEIQVQSFAMALFWFGLGFLWGNLCKMHTHLLLLLLSPSSSNFRGLWVPACVHSQLPPRGNVPSSTVRGPQGSQEEVVARKTVGK